MHVRLVNSDESDASKVGLGDENTVFFVDFNTLNMTTEIKKINILDHKDYNYNFQT